MYEMLQVAKLFVADTFEGPHVQLTEKTGEDRSSMYLLRGLTYLITLKFPEFEDYPLSYKEALQLAIRSIVLKFSDKRYNLV